MRKEEGGKRGRKREGSQERREKSEERGKRSDLVEKKGVGIKKEGTKKWREEQTVNDLKGVQQQDKGRFWVEENRESVNVIYRGKRKRAHLTQM